MEKRDWDIAKFRELAKDRLAPSKFKEIVLPLISIPWKVSICHYHREEYHRLSKEPLTVEKLHPKVEMVGKILHQAAKTSAGKRISIELFMAEAHMIAFAQSLHSTADILAHIIFYCLGLEQYSFPKEKISLYNIQKWMEEKNFSSKILDPIKTLKDAEEYKYLSAYVNTTKHKSLILSNLKVNFSETEKQHGLSISEFIYKEHLYLQRWADDFIDIDFKRLSDLLIEIGCSIDEYMRSK